MENKEKIAHLSSQHYDQFEEDDDNAEDDTLSFCNFPLSNNGSPTSSPSDYSSHHQDDQLFEFSTNNSSSSSSSSSSSDESQNYHTTPNHILLFGKTIDHKKIHDLDVGFTISRKPLDANYQCFVKNYSSGPARMDSYYDSMDSVSNAQKVNISALTSMSSKSRKIMFMFGPVKFMPEMELSAIKQRQMSKRDLNEIVAAGNGGGGGSKVAGKSEAGGRRQRQWGLLRSLRSRARFGNLLARSFGCFPTASNMERWIV